VSSWWCVDRALGGCRSCNIQDERQTHPIGSFL
jgi:hypothetical protein